MIVRLAGNGDAASGGGVFSSAFRPRIAPNGSDVAFTATVAGVRDFGVYVSRGPRGKLEAIARPGDFAPGGGVITSAFRATVNSRGDVAYGAMVTGSPARSLFIARKNRWSQPRSDP
jgi:hypothetical protein